MTPTDSDWEWQFVVPREVSYFPPRGRVDPDPTVGPDSDHGTTEGGGLQPHWSAAGPDSRRRGVLQDGRRPC